MRRCPTHNFEELKYAPFYLPNLHIISIYSPNLSRAPSENVVGRFDAVCGSSIRKDEKSVAGIAVAQGEVHSCRVLAVREIKY